MKILAAIAAVAVTVSGLAALAAAPSTNEGEMTVALPVCASQVASVVPFIEAAAREMGHKNVRRYTKDVFLPMPDDHANVSFMRDDAGALTLHVEVESAYRYQKAERAAVLERLKLHGQGVLDRALQLQRNTAGVEAGAIAAAGCAVPHAG